jgi:cell division protein FtsL
MIRILLIGLLLVNLALGISNASQQKKQRDLNHSLEQLKRKEQEILREHDQLTGEYNLRRGASEDQIIARSTLGMSEPASVAGTINIPAMPSSWIAEESR